MTEREIFLAAIERPETERDAYLNEACGDDAALRAKVATLLLSHNGAGSFLGKPLVSSPDPDHAATRAFTPEAKTSIAPGRTDDTETEHTFLAPPGRPDSLGRIGHYEVLQFLGRGGFGIVFRAFDEILQRVVAVKVMAPQLAATSPARKRFLREARSSAQVRHENVVQVYEVGENPLPYLVMEFIPGETLQQMLTRTGPLDPAEAVGFGRQIAEGLAAAHAADLVHRDIKPGNVLIESGQNRVKITDFGLARAADDASISQSGIVAGTPMYMSPEQALGHKLDQRADLFSLGSVLYQMVAGRPPFRANNTLAVLKRVAEDTPRSIHEIVPETPQWLCDIISKLHAKNPDERYQSAREVADVLAECSAQLQASSKVRDFPRVPPNGHPAAARTGKWKWKAAAILALSATSLIVSELTGVSQLLRRPETAADVNLDTPASMSRKEPPPLAIAPFDEIKAKEHQNAWATHLGVSVEYTDDLGQIFRLIPPGSSPMGSTDAQITKMLSQAHDDVDRSFFQSEGPQRTIEFLRPFYIGVQEVKVGPFREFVQATGYQTSAETSGKGGRAWNGETRLFEQKPELVWNNPQHAPNDRSPLMLIDLADARAFCSWLSKREGRQYKVVTEEQWEYACRAGITTQWFWGDDVKEEQLHVQMVPRPKPLNAFGINMRGCGWEFATDSLGEMVLRGCGRSASPMHLRHATRKPVALTPAGFMPTVQYGFRLAIVGEFTPSIARPDAPRPAANAPPLAIAPFTADQAKAHQDAWAKHLGVPVEYTDSFGHTLRLIPPGEFEMGTSEKDIEQLIADQFTDKEWAWLVPRLRSESPVRKVRINSAYYEAIHETTVRQFRAFVKAAGYKTRAELDGGGVTPNEARSLECVWNGPKFATNEDAPARFLVRDDAAAYCRWLNRQTGRDYAIPSEQQWEFACRAGTTSTWSHGNDQDELRRFGWTAWSGRKEPLSVGLLVPNAFGLYDVHGNVSEVALDPTGDPYHRGGSFGEGPAFARSTMRTAIGDTLPYRTTGFRIIEKSVKGR